MSKETQTSVVAAMNELELIRSINDAFTKVKKTSYEYDKRAFFIACKNPIREFIEAKMRESVLFFGLSVGHLNDDKYELLKSDDSDTEFNFFGEVKENKAFQDKIRAFLADTHNDTIINLTSVLLKSEYGADLFMSEIGQYFEDYRANGILTKCSRFGERPYSFDLSKLSYTENFENFREDKGNCIATNDFISLVDGLTQKDYEKVIKYLWHYKMITKEIQHLHPIIHLIRPRIAKPEYNLLLTIVTSGKLELTEVAFFNDLVYRIMSTAVMGRREKEFENKVDMFSHGFFQSLKNAQTIVAQNIETTILNIQDNNNAYKQLKQIEIDFRFITGRGIQTDKLNSVRKIVEFIKTHQISNDIECDFEISLPDNSDNLKDAQIMYAYLVIWNLYHNASKGHKKLEKKAELWPVNIRIYEYEGQKAFSIKNCGEIPNMYKEQLLNKDQSKVVGYRDENTKHGLTIIKESMNKLNWSVLGVKVENRSTEIIIITNQAKL